MKQKAHFKTETITVMTAMEKTRAVMPRYNPFQTGYGVCGDTKYNRNKEKIATKRLLKESGY